MKTLMSDSALLIYDFIEMLTDTKAILERRLLYELQQSNRKYLHTAVRATPNAFKPADEDLCEPRPQLPGEGHSRACAQTLSCTSVSSEHAFQPQPNVGEEQRCASITRSVNHGCDDETLLGAEVWVCAAVCVCVQGPVFWHQKPFGEDGREGLQ